MHEDRGISRCMHFNRSEHVILGRQITCTVYKSPYANVSVFNHTDEPYRTTSDTKYFSNTKMKLKKMILRVRKKRGKGGKKEKPIKKYKRNTKILFEKEDKSFFT